MANITVTHTFVNGTPADATEVNTNFSDIIAGTSDGTKDFSISALTVAGTANFSGAVNLNGATTTLGNAVTDNIVFTGRVASDFDPIATATYSFGSTSLTWKDLYLDNGATDGGAIYFNASSSSFIKSDAAGTDLDISGFTNLDLNGLAITGAAGASFDGAVVINESGADVDFRVEGDTDTNLLFCDASTDRVGLGLNNPSAPLEVKKSNAGGYIVRVENTSATGLGLAVVSGSTTSTDRIITAFASSNEIFSLMGDGKLGIGTSSPQTAFDVSSSSGSGPKIRTTFDNGANNLYAELDPISLTQYRNTGSVTDFTISTSGTAGGDIILSPATGNVGIGTTSPSYPLDVYRNTASGYVAHFSQDSATGYGILIDSDSTVSGDPIIEVLNGSGNVFRVDSNGTVSMDVTNWGSSSTQDVGISGTTGFSTLQKFTSSRRYKDDIKPYQFDTSKIYQLVGKEFTWKESGEWDFGGIAEEVEEVLPELVNYRLKHIDNDPEKGLIPEYDENGNKMVESIRYRQFTFVLLEEMKKLKIKVDALEAKLAG